MRIVGLVVIDSFKIVVRNNASIDTRVSAIVVNVDLTISAAHIDIVAAAVVVVDAARVDVVVAVVIVTGDINTRTITIAFNRLNDVAVAVTVNNIYTVAIEVLGWRSERLRVRVAKRGRSDVVATNPVLVLGSDLSHSGLGGRARLGVDAVVGARVVSESREVVFVDGDGRILKRRYHGVRSPRSWRVGKSSVVILRLRGSSEHKSSRIVGIIVDANTVRVDDCGSS